MKDEKAIQNLITTWQESSKAGNLSGLLELMTDDVVFLTPGQIPMDKASFIEGFKLMMEQVTLDSNSDIQDLVISGNLAYCWSHLSVAVKPKQSGTAIRKSGYTLTVFRKEQDGWKLARDANMLTTQAT